MSDSPDTDRGMLLIVSAPSGAGKTSLVAALLERDPRMVVSVSHTTRQRRARERNGINYHFIDEARFCAMIEADEFLEHAEVFGNRYGTSAAAVDTELDRGRDVILEIDFQGAAQVRRRYPDTVSIFILPPSATTLQTRLTSRGEDDDSVIRQRLDKARWEMSHYRDYDYLIVNDDFETALADLSCIVRAQRLRRERQQIRLHALISALLDEDATGA
jgi:guanylate kinase